MKNRKSSKIVMLVLALALVIGATAAITASADESTAPVVLSQNVEYADSFALMYAITADSVKGETVTVEVFEDAACEGEACWSKTVAATEENQTTVHGTACYVIKTAGIAAKNLDTQYYVKVTAGGASTVKRYSVAEYLYERLYKNGVAFGTTDADKARAKLYNTVLQYGADAQDVLYNYNVDENGSLITEDDRTAFVTDMKYVYVADEAGTVDGTYTAGIVFSGTEITLTVNAPIAGWALYDLTTGEPVRNIAEGESFTADTHIKAEAITTHRGSGKYADHKNTVSYEGATLESLIASGDLAENTTRPNTNKTVSFSDGALVYTSKGSSWGSIDFWGDNLHNGTFVVETDLYVEGATIDASRASVLSASSKVGTGDGWISLISIYSNTDTTVGGYILAGYNTDKTAVIPEGEWVNVRYEADGSAAGSAARFYVNGVLIAETTLAKSMLGAQGVQFRHASTSGGSGFSAGVMMLDNTYVGEMPFGGERGTGNYYGSAIQYTGKAYADLTADGTFTDVKTGASVYVGKTGDNDALILSYVANSNWGRYSIKRNGTADSLVFETDILFNNIDIPAGRGFMVYGVTDLAKDGNKDVFGFKITKLADGGYGISLNKTSNYHRIEQGEWMNVRIECDSLSGSTLRLIVNGEVVDTYAFSASLTDLVGVQLMFSSTYSGTTGFTGDVYLDNTYLGDK